MNFSVLSITIAFLVLTMVREQLCFIGVHIIRELNNYYRFDHNIFLTDSTDILDDLLDELDNSTPQTIYVFDELNCAKPPAWKTGKNTFVIVAFTEPSLEIFDQIQAIQRLDYGVKIGFFLADTTLNLIIKIFRWSWECRIVNVLIAFESNTVDDDVETLSVFKYDPFGEVKLINVTGSRSPREYFFNEIPNYRGLAIQFLYMNDSIIRDFEYDFWDAVLGAFNATILNNYKTLADYNTGKPVIADLMYHEHFLGGTKALSLYPYRQSRLVMIVLHSRPYSDFVVYLQNASWMTLFVYAIVMIVMASVLLTVSTYLEKKKILLFRSVVDVLNLLLNENSSIDYRHLSYAAIFVVLPLTFAGMIAMNGIVSVVQSYITLPIYEPQINTMKDLYTSSIPIMVEKLKWPKGNTEMLEKLTGFDGWNNRFHNTDPDELAKITQTLNNSVAYFLADHHAYGLLQLQDRLDVKAYHLIRETGLSGNLMSFLVNRRFPYIDHMNDIVHRLNGAGLIDKWVKDQTRRGMQYVWRQNVIGHSNSPHSDTNELSVLTVVWYGWAASLIVFVGEVFWRRMKSAGITRIFYNR